MIWLMMGTAVCALVGAVCGVLCLLRLRRPAEAAPDVSGAGEDDGMREGIINLMRYSPETGKEEKG